MFSELMVWDDQSPRSPASQMAVDEALFRIAQCPVLRLYRWAVPAVTFGYSQRWREVESLCEGRPAVRRWTGGGVVFHGGDLTVAIVIPGAPTKSSESLYAEIHSAIRLALADEAARLASGDELRSGAACFVSPAANDVMIGGAKVCGGALRRCRQGVLYQGSIQTKKAPAPHRLAGALSEHVTVFLEVGPVEDLAREIESSHYGQDFWNRLR